MLFQGKERMAATLLNVQPKLKRAKQGQDGEKLKFIELSFEAQLTASLKGKLSARLQPLVASRDEESDAQSSSAVNKVDLAVPSMEGIVRLFGFNTFGKTSKAKAVLGALGQPAAHVGFTNIHFKDGEAYLGVRICSQHTPELWSWAGETYGESERDITLEIEPQKDLFEKDEASDAADDGEEDEA